MPSANSTLGWTIVNWGPVPQTYTKAPSCTAATDIWIAYKDMPSIGLTPSACVSAPTETCWPTPTDNSLMGPVENSRWLGPYWSGVSCPSEWTSIGQAAHPTNGPVTSAGVFQGPPGRVDNPDEDDSNDDDPIIFGWQDALGALLDPGETAIACCPSSMSFAPWGACYSTLPSPVSTACDAVWPTVASTLVTTSYMLDGTTYTGPVTMAATNSVGFTPITSTVKTFAANQTSTLVAVSIHQPIYVVHQESDVPSAEGVRGGKNEGPEETTSAETNAAAARFYTGESGWGRVWGMLGVLGLSTLAGFMLVLPV